MSEPSLFDSEPDPIRRYTQDGQPSSGYSGADPSKEAEKIRSENQRRCLAYAVKAQSRGVTSKEAREALDLHQGTSSSALNALQHKNHVSMLTEKRHDYHVYVLTSLVNGREVIPPVIRPSRKELAQAAFLAGAAAAWLSQSGRKMSFDEWWETQ